MKLGREATAMSDEYIIIPNVVLKKATKNAVLISYEDEEMWIPRSLLAYRCDKEIELLERNNIFDLHLMEWKAAELGLG